MNPINSINSFLNKTFGVPYKPIATPTATGQMYTVNQTPATPAATSPAPTVIAPPKKKLPPSGQDYIKSLSAGTNTPATPPAYDNTTGLLTDYGRSQGLPEVNAPKTNTGTSGSGANTSGTSSNESAYITYLKSLFNPAEAKKAQANVNELNKRIATETLGARKREDIIRANEVGQLERGQNYDLLENSRKSNRSLADLAIAKGASTDILKQYDEAGKAIYDAEQALLENNKPVEVGGVLYQKQSDGSYKSVAGNQKLDTSVVEVNGQKVLIDNQTGKTIKTLGSAGGGGAGGAGGIYTPGVNPTVDAWAERIQNGSAKITDIPASQAGLRNAVTVALQDMGNSAEGKPTTTELGKAALVDAQALLDKFDRGEGTSAVGKSAFLNSLGYGLIPGTARANFVNDFNSIKSKLSLEAVKYLKGQGQVSDAERALLSQAVTKLNLTQSESEFRSTLESIINKLKGYSLAETSNSSNVDDEEASLRAMGYTDEQIKQLKETP